MHVLGSVPAQGSLEVTANMRWQVSDELASVWQRCQTHWACNIVNQWFFHVSMVMHYNVKIFYYLNNWGAWIQSSGTQADVKSTLQKVAFGLMDVYMQQLSIIQSNEPLCKLFPLATWYYVSKYGKGTEWISGTDQWQCIQMLLSSILSLYLELGSVRVLSLVTGYCLADLHVYLHVHKPGHLKLYPK